jgi:hypothetical protein
VKFLHNNLKERDILEKNLLWMENKVYSLVQQRRLFLCVLFVLCRTAECAQPL